VPAQNFSTDDLNRRMIKLRAFGGELGADRSGAEVRADGALLRAEEGVL
jgi:hypothetical protein